MRIGNKKRGKEKSKERKAKARDTGNTTRGEEERKTSQVVANAAPSFQNAKAYYCEQRYKLEHAL